MAENIIKNPFSECTARDMSYLEVQQYWCSPFRLYDLSEGELLTCRTPIVIEGIRGTGKTMIMKYLSYFIQKKLCDSVSMEEKLNFFKNRSVGVYFRYKQDFRNLFEELDCDVVNKERIFKRYYELFIVRQILEILEDFYGDCDTYTVEKVLCSFFSIEHSSINGVCQYINSLIKEMDQILNSAIYDDGWINKMMPLIGSRGLVTDLICTISNDIPGWEDVLFVIWLDEYENVGIFQPLINTLLKQVDDTVNLTYRLGMRPAGMDNNKTNVSAERLQVDRDFLLRPLNYKRDKDYEEFAVNISKKRLKSIDIFRENCLTDIAGILGEKEDFDEEAASIVGKGTKHFKLLREYFPEQNRMQEVIEELSCDEKLMEMYNILRVMRGGQYNQIGALSRKYRELRDAKQLSSYIKSNPIESKDIKKYRLDYSGKYRLTLLYILLTVYGERKQYYSFNTFLKLSSGSINDFISLCRNTFKHMNDSMLEDLKDGKPICRQIQTFAAVDTAEDQRRKIAMSSNNGNKLYTFIDSMGSIFEEYHRDLWGKYPETNQFAFADENEIRNDSELNYYLIELINSGAIIRKNKRQLKSVGNTARGELYLLNRIFAPIYQYSYRTRGGFNPIISKQNFNLMLHKSIDAKKYVKGNKEEMQQFRMFDFVKENEDGSTYL